VDDLDDLYVQVDLVINPVWLGSGLKIKTVEALNKNKHLLTTPKGIDGMPNGAHNACIIAKNSDEIILKISEFVRGEIDLDTLQEARIHYVKTKLLPQEQQKELRDFLRSLRKENESVTV
jgi:hypothetical protein